MAPMTSPRRKVRRYTVKIKKDSCKGCSYCVAFCPTGHLTLSDQLNKRGVTYALVKEGTVCTGCGSCFFMCPECCIEVYEEK